MGNWRAVKRLDEHVFISLETESYGPPLAVFARLLALLLATNCPRIYVCRGATGPWGVMAGATCLPSSGQGAGRRGCDELAVPIPRSLVSRLAESTNVQGEWAERCAVCS